MADNKWMYARGQQQFGPVTLEQLQQLMQTGQVQSADLVWTDGMAQWAPAGTVPQLQGNAVSAVGATPVMPLPSTPAPAQVSYYAAGGGMPPRAVERLKGHARPTGDVGDWPLDEHHIETFAETARLRRRIVRAANMYRALMALTILGCVAMVFVLIAAMSSPRGGGAVGGIVIGVLLAVSVGFTVLYGLAARATMRSHRWAPLTIVIVWSVSLAFNVLSVAMSPTRSAAFGYNIGGLVFGFVIGLAVIIYSLQAFSAIPQYCSQPAWCQELAVRSEVDKKRRESSRA